MALHGLKIKQSIFALVVVAVCFMAEGESYGPPRRSNFANCPRPYSNGLFPYPPDCSKFLNCAHGRPYLQDCAPGTLFNARIGVCDWPYNTECGGHGGEGVLDPRVNYVRWKLIQLFKRRN